MRCLFIVVSNIFIFGDVTTNVKIIYIIKYIICYKQIINIHSLMPLNFIFMLSKYDFNHVS